MAPFYFNAFNRDFDNFYPACVAGVKRGRGRRNLGARERAREKGKERLQGDHCFLHFSRSDSERENSDWSELIKCQSST